jgi:hypothetical protein
MNKRTHPQGEIQTQGDGGQTLILQDVTRDLELEMTTRIEGSIAQGVKIYSDDPSAHLSVTKLTPGVEIRIEGEFSSPHAQNANIEANYVDIGLLENRDYNFAANDGKNIKVQGRSYISAEGDAYIDEIKGRNDPLRKGVPNAEISGERVVINGKVTEGHFYPAPLTDKERDKMPSYAPPSNSAQPATSKSKKNEVNMGELQAHLKELALAPNISKQNVRGPAPKNSEPRTAKDKMPPIEQPLEGQINKLDGLKERLEGYKAGPKVSKKNVMDYVEKDETDKCPSR